MALLIIITVIVTYLMVTNFTINLGKKWIPYKGSIRTRIAAYICAAWSFVSLSILNYATISAMLGILRIPPFASVSGALEIEYLMLLILFITLCIKLTFLDRGPIDQEYQKHGEVDNTAAETKYKEEVIQKMSDQISDIQNFVLENKGLAFTLGLVFLPAVAGCGFMLHFIRSGISRK